MVKRGGLAGINEWARENGIATQNGDDYRMRALMPALLISLGRSILIWFLLPIVTELVIWSGSSVCALLPSSIGSSGVYVAAQIAPILFSSIIVLFLRPGKREWSGSIQTFLENSTLLMGIFVLVIVYCFGVMLFDLGLNISGVNRGNIGELAQRFPYHALQAIIADLACFIVLSYPRRIAASPMNAIERAGRVNLVFRAFAAMIACVSVPALIYAYSRSIQHFADQPDVFQYVLLVVALNVLGGLIALVAAILYYGGEYNRSA